MTADQTIAELAPVIGARAACVALGRFEHADAAVINAIARVTGGNCRLVQRPFAPIERILAIKPPDRHDRSGHPGARETGRRPTRTFLSSSRTSTTFNQSYTELRDGQQLHLVREQTNLVTLAYRVVDDFQLDASHVSVAETAGPELLDDRDAGWIGRAISNLVNNAIKYSPSGSHIALSLCRESTADGAWAVLNVHDHGVGIPADVLPRVFDHPYPERNVVGKVNGTGIGLAGVRQIIEQRGGRVSGQHRVRRNHRQRAIPAGCRRA